MKNILVFVSVTLCIVALVITASQAGPSKAPGVERLTGKVTSINLSDKTIVVESPGAGMTFDLGAARFRGCNSINDIKNGDKVTVQYVMKQGRALAKVVSRHKPSR